MKLRDLTADFVKTLEPYASPGDSTDATKIWLNANEYPTATKFEARFETLNRYPEVQPGEVIRRYAEYAGVKSSQVLVTRGADEAIELLISVRELVLSMLQSCPLKRICCWMSKDYVQNLNNQTKTQKLSFCADRTTLRERWLRRRLSKSF